MDPRYKSPATNVVREEEEFTFRDLGFITRSLQWLLRAGVLAILLNIAAAYLTLQMLGGPYTEAEAQATDTRDAAVGGLQTLLTIVTIVVFARWILLAHRNLPALAAQDLDVRPGWAVGWFFIPFANLWKPYQAMRTLWQASHDAPGWKLGETTWILPAWWMLWLISSFVGYFLIRSVLGAQSVERLVFVTQIAMVNSAIDVPLYILASLLVGRIWQAQLAQRQPGAAGVQQQVISG